MTSRTAFSMLLVLAMAGTASAQTTRIGPMLGYNTDVDEVTLGLNGHIGVDLGDREVILGFVAELFPFLDGLTNTIIDVDALLPKRLGSLELYGGGGLTVRHRAFQSGPTDTDVGLNLKGGVIFESSTRGWSPFAEVVQTIGADTDFSVRGGVFFRIGGR